MRWNPSSVVVCADGDDTWGYGSDRVLVIPQLRAYARIKGRRRLPFGPVLRHIFQPLLSRIQRDDLVWCHSQPHFSAALERPLHAKGAKLIHHSDSSIAGYANRIAFQKFTPDAFIFVSEAIRQEALALFLSMKNSYVIHNGADEALFYPPPAGTIRGNAAASILYVGRLIPEKGVHVLIEAMRLLQKRDVLAVCRVVGSSYAGGSKPTSYVTWLQKQCPSNVQFEGFYSGKDVAKVYREADIFCCPSIYQEPFGNVNIEAMACGIPVIASRVGGIPEIAAQGGVVLVEPNSASELAAALQNLIEDPCFRSTVATQGRRAFQRRFTWSVIFEKYREILKSVNYIEAGSETPRNEDCDHASVVS